MQASIRQLTIRQLIETDRRCRELLEDARQERDRIVQSIEHEQRRIHETHDQHAQSHLFELEKSLQESERQSLAESERIRTERIAALDTQMQLHFERWVSTMVEAVLSD